MAAQAKYIIAEEVTSDGLVQYDVPFVFPLCIAHSSFASKMGITKIQSAGFCRFYSDGADVEVSTFGEHFLKG